MNTALAPVRRLRPLFDDSPDVMDQRFAPMVPTTPAVGHGAVQQLEQRQTNLEQQIGQLVTTMQGMMSMPVPMQPAAPAPAPVPQQTEVTQAKVRRKPRKIAAEKLRDFFD